LKESAVAPELEQPRFLKGEADEVVLGAVLKRHPYLGERIADALRERGDPC
jgi:hypothetical protein